MSQLSLEEEAVLVERLKRRDEAAFSQFVIAHQQRIYALLGRMLNNREEAKDVAQDVFLTVFKNIDSFRGDSRLSTWLYRVAINHCKNRIKYLDRRGSKKHDVLDDTREGDVSDGSVLGGRMERPDEQAQGNELEVAVRRALASLDEDHRELIVLRDLEGLAYEEIVTITGLPDGTVKSRLHRARAALREAIERGVGWKIQT
ncbi:MAG: sigma-70 family RNA polymerase sigma factor [Deltaproteobacteria bacterium]|nr:sigma-70 family RNA polymerase sigma factor [Deltaproteobacteria bacterium]